MKNKLTKKQTALAEEFYEKAGDAVIEIKALSRALSADKYVLHARPDFLTPMQTIQVHDPVPHTLIIAREDLSPVASFKLRGAYIKIKKLLDEGDGIEKLVAVSAGNHAQGVAWTANHFEIPAVIFMPKSAPESKVKAVEKFGGEHVTIELVDGALKNASIRAKEYVEEHDYTMIHPYDDMDVIAGQATIMTEVIEELGEGENIDIIFSQVGGGGMTSGVGMIAKQANPKCRVIAVEEENQACLTKAFKAEKPTEIEHDPSTHCEGTSVGTIGALGYEFCKICVDDVVLNVTQDEVDAAVIGLFGKTHSTIETSGSMGFAGYKQFVSDNPDAITENSNVLVIASGANIDPNKIHVITADSAMKLHEKKYFKFELDEENGNLLELLKDIMPDINVSSFIYGKMDEEKALPIIGFSAAEDRLDKMEMGLNAYSVKYQAMSEDDVKAAKFYRCEPILMQTSKFFKIEFREGAGSLRNLLEAIKDSAGLTFFDYEYEGDTRGIADMAFETDDVNGLTDIFDLTDGVVDYKRVQNPYHQHGLSSTLSRDI